MSEATELAERLLASFPCNCEPAWYERHLVDTYCVHHDIADEVDMFVTCDCERCRWLRDAG